VIIWWLSLEFWRRFYSPSPLFYSASWFFGFIFASFCFFFPIVCGLSIAFIRQENALCSCLWIMRYIHSCLRKNTGTNSPVIAGLLVTTHSGIWRYIVWERDIGKLVGLVRDVTHNNFGAISSCWIGLL